METREDEELARLREMSSAELVRLAIEEARRAALAELVHAHEELKEELAEGRMAAVLLAGAAGLGLCALAVGFVLIGLALPVDEVGAMAIVGGALAFVAGWLAFLGFMRLPKHPLKKSRERMAELLTRAQEELERPSH